MRSKVLVLMSVFLICIFISNSFLCAQSKDRNNPTPLRSKVISGVDGGGYWYKLTAGPGELVIEMSVGGAGASWSSPMGHARFVLYDKDMQEVMNESISGGWNGEERKRKSLKLKSKQDFLLNIGASGGTYMIRFKGAIDLPPEKEQR